MRGEIADYKESLRQRVALLEGVSVASMEQVYRERLRLNPGAAELGAEDDRSTLRYKRTPAVAIGVVRQSKANIISVADKIRSELPRIQASLPPGRNRQAL